jgi:anti-sigma-K factor RskA
MNEHPHDLLPAFALGALDADEASQVLQHVAACTSCRTDIEAWGAVVGLLPYTVVPQIPPAYVKHRLFAMIDVSPEARPGARLMAQGRRGGAQRWMGAAAACSLALVLVLGLLFANERGRADTLSAQLGEHERTIQLIRAQLDREHQETVFISTAVGQPLESAQAGAKGKMYMRPGSKHAVLVVYGLKPPAEGKVYQLWLATADRQVPSNTFTVGSDGATMLAIDAPAPVNEYTQVMVTVEPAPGSQKPSEVVVLQASL